MNLLVVDVGNTNIVLGIYRGDELATSWRLATMRERTADEYGILVRQLIGAEWSLEGAIVSSVVPPLNGTIASMIEKFFGIEPMFVEPGVKTGIAIQVDNPQEVGADRIVNAVAAHAAHGGPIVIVDFGTATTFDVVTGDVVASAAFFAVTCEPAKSAGATSVIPSAARDPVVLIDVGRAARRDCGRR